MDAFVGTQSAPCIPSPDGVNPCANLSNDAFVINLAEMASPSSTSAFSGGEGGASVRGRTGASLCAPPRAPGCDDAAVSRGPRYVRIKNLTRGTSVGDRIRVASSAWDRSVGLLRTPEVRPGEGLWIERSPSIHMFFMRYAIDAVFVSGEGRVTRSRHTSSHGGWCCGPEAPATAWSSGGRRGGSGTQVGDELRLVDIPA